MSETQQEILALPAPSSENRFSQQPSHVLFDLGKITLGADPEIFVMKRGRPISAHVFECGTKEKPQQTENGSVQVDGLALEVNVRPALTKLAFVRNVSHVMQDLADIVATKDNEAYLMVAPSMTFGKEYISSLPEAVRELGCNPDWNAYEVIENPTPDGNVDFRTAGGHIHIGWGDVPNHDSLQHIGLCAEVAKQLDYLIGLPSLQFDKDNRRRSLYGKAGCFRPKKYGMEYRTLSPAWLNSIRHTSMIYDRTMKALRLMNEGVILDEMFDGFAREAIDSNNAAWPKEAPKELLQHLG